MIDADLTGVSPTTFRAALYGICNTRAGRRGYCALGGIGCNIEHRRHASEQLWQLLTAACQKYGHAPDPPPQLAVALGQIGAMAAIATLELAR